MQHDESMDGVSKKEIKRLRGDFPSLEKRFEAMDDELKEAKQKIDRLSVDERSRPIVLLLESEYLANRAFYDAQPILWGIHKTAIPEE